MACVSISCSSARVIRHTGRMTPGSRASSAWPIVDEPEAVEPPLRREHRDAETGCHLILITECGPRLAHRGLRHQELSAEDVRLALERAVGVLRDVLRATVGRRGRRTVRVTCPVCQL